MQLTTADGQPIRVGQQVYPEPRNLQAIPPKRAGKVVEIRHGTFPGGIVVVHWNGSRMVAVRLFSRTGGWRTQVHDIDIALQAMRPSELLSAPDAVGRLV